MSDRAVNLVTKEFEPQVIESENPPALIEISEADGIFYNDKFSKDRRLRQAIYDKILAAKEHLPSDLYFMIYEAYRPRARQFELWEMICKQMSTEHPEASDEELTALCSNFVSNPYGVGSGHQFGCAIDITLCDENRVELDMGTEMQEFCERTETAFAGITEQQKQNRQLLCSVLEKEGLINYPSEWWHFSYGDRLWAQITGQSQTVYGVLPF